MASKAADSSGFGQIITALATMQSNVGGKQKADAHEYLEKFQKSVCVVNTVLELTDMMYRQKHGT